MKLVFFIFINFYISISSSIRLPFFRKSVGTPKISPEKQQVVETQKKERFLFPQFPSDNKLLGDDECVFEFYGKSPESDPDCVTMDRLVLRAEQLLSVRLNRIRLGSFKGSMELFDAMGGNVYKELPYYYNRRTAEGVAGRMSLGDLIAFITSILWMLHFHFLFPLLFSLFVGKKPVGTVYASNFLEEKLKAKYKPTDSVDLNEKIPSPFRNYITGKLKNKYSRYYYFLNPTYRAASLEKKKLMNVYDEAIEKRLHDVKKGNILDKKGESTIWCNFYDEWYRFVHPLLLHIVQQ
jgi:hypothetical protein